jgi:exonuclease VII large subunit
MSDHPVHTVDLAVLVPVLEELEVDFAAAFVRVPSEAAAQQEATRSSAREAARRVVSKSRRERLAEADAELEAVADRLEHDLRQSHPELFDRRGRLRQRALAQLLVQRFGGKRTISGEELRALLEREDRPAPAGAS